MPLCDTAGHKQDSPRPAGSPQGRFFQRPGGQSSGRFLTDRRGNRQPGQRPGTGGYDVYLQAAQTELQEAVRGRKEVAEADCAEVRFTEKSKAPAGEKISGRQKQILQTEDTMKKDDRERCSWATTELYKEYHDEEWGKPVHDDRKLFEMLVLEGMQAGLSWLTILNKRAAFKEAFNEFDYQKIALYDETKIDELMQNPNIVRNRLKIKSTITNAQQFIKIQEEYGSFDKFTWSYVKNRPIHNHFKSEADIPATTPLSDRISKDLKKRGFKFVGSTIIYAYMQAIGIVNDHVKGCYLYVPE